MKLKEKQSKKTVYQLSLNEFEAHALANLVMAIAWEEQGLEVAQFLEELYSVLPAPSLADAEINQVFAYQD